MAKPWHNDYIYNPSNDDSENSVDTTCPEDLLFCIAEDPEDNCGEEGDIVVIFTPVEVWKSEQCQYDQSLDIDGLLKKLGSKLELPEMMESTHESNMSAIDTRAELLKLGFKEDIDFTKFVNGIDFNSIIH